MYFVKESLQALNVWPTCDKPCWFYERHVFEEFNKWGEATAKITQPIIVVSGKTTIASNYVKTTDYQITVLVRG